MNNPVAKLLVLTVAVVLTGCSPDVSINPAPIEVAFNVKRAGKPLTDLALNLQPIAEGAQSVGMIDKGVAKLFVVPGTYTYYVTEGKSPIAAKAIPEAFKNGSMDRQIKIESAAAIDIAFD